MENAPVDAQDAEIAVRKHLLTDPGAAGAPDVHKSLRTGRSPCPPAAALAPWLRDEREMHLQPRFTQTDFVWVYCDSASKHLSRPLPVCLKPPQSEVMSP